MVVFNLVVESIIGIILVVEGLITYELHGGSFFPSPELVIMHDENLQNLIQVDLLFDG